MAQVMFGSARLGSNGRITGDLAGDNNGKEVSKQSYYVHSKGWRVFRAKDRTKAKLIAKAMNAACDNDNIGYDQGSRNSLYNLAAKVSFDPARVTSKCETDCSALVRVCCAYAGIMVKDFITSNEAAVLLSSGAFTELTGDKYTKQSAYLATGDILVTKTKGHTGVILNDGPKAEIVGVPEAIELGDRLLKNGSEGEDVRELQRYLISIGYDCGSWGPDGDFGDATEMALMNFQRDHGLEVDGQYGPKSHAAMLAALESAEIDVKNPRNVRIVNGNCYVRTAPATNGYILGVAHKGEVYNYGGEDSATGWHLIEFAGANGWVSGKYSEFEE